jgi:hypothetical protein
MNKDAVARKNHLVLYVRLPLIVSERNFQAALLESLWEEGIAQYPFSSRNSPDSGYVHIDTKSVITNCSHGSLEEAIRSGLLQQLVLMFPRETSGELNTSIVVVHDRWRFTFTITKYERDSEHDYEMVEDPLLLPDDEVLGRFIELKITIDE